MEPESQELGRRGARSIDEMSFAWVTVTYLEEDDYQQRVAERRRRSTTTSEPRR